MKTKTKKNLAVATIGALFIVGVFAISYLHEPKLHLTTPEKDAYKIGQQVETIRTENDLRKLEKLAYEYELAYRHSYNGATAMHFKALVEPYIIAAGDRRDAIRKEEERLEAAQQEFEKHLNDIDVAWRMELGSDAEVLQIIAQKRAAIAELEESICQLTAHKEQLAEAAWSGSGGSLDQKCLEEIGEVEKDIAGNIAEIEELEYSIDLVLLACRLQRGEAPVVEEPEVEAVVEADFECETEVEEEEFEL